MAVVRACLIVVVMLLAWWALRSVQAQSRATLAHVTFSPGQVQLSIAA